MCLGISLGVAVGSVIDVKKRANNKTDKQIPSEPVENEDKK